MMKLLIVASLILCLPVLALGQKARKAFAYDYTIDDLPNGLRLITIPTDYPNLVALYIVVQTGSRNEPEKGKSGYAHSDSIVFSRSVDHAVTWATPLRISPSAQDGAVQGCQVAVGPNGEVYVAYEVFYIGGQRQHLMAKSVNGGLTFSTPHAITPVFNEINFKSKYRKNSFVALTVSPLDGHVYAVYAAQTNRTAGADVMFVASADAGASFTSPKVINDVATGQQFFPAITADTSSVIHISWFDTRNSGGNTALYDVFATYSKDNGATFAPNTRVTPALINAGTATFIGDYAGIAAAMGFAHPVWTSGGFNNGRLQTATLQLP